MKIRQSDYLSFLMIISQLIELITSGFDISFYGEPK